MTKAIPDLLGNGLPAGAIPADDPGLRYGDGVFETLAVRNGKPEFWARHWRRLQRGAERLGIEAPPEATLIGEAKALLGTPRDGVLRIWLTRGSGGEGYRPATSQRPTRILRLDPFPTHPKTAKTEGVAVRLAKTRLGRNPALAGIKHLNRLEQVLAANEETDSAIAEALMADDAGNLIEGTRTNVFLVIEGVLTTPDLSEAGVAGILREVALEEAKRMGWKVAVRPICPEEAKKAEEFFLTNSLIHLWPVRQFEKRTYDIGTYTRELAERVGLRASHERGLPRGLA